MMPSKNDESAPSEGKAGHIGEIWEWNKSDDQSNYDKIHGLVMIMYYHYFNFCYYYSQIKISFFLQAKGLKSMQKSILSKDIELPVLLPRSRISRLCK